MENEEQKLIEKALKIEKEKKLLINKILSGNLVTLRDQVGFILNNSNEARNSDIELAWKYWQTFENDLFGGTFITKKDLKKLTKIVSLARSRARIQNDYKLFQANEDVKKYRGILSQEMKEKAIEEKPSDLPIYHIYIDETGKTQKYLSVGSLWIVEGFKSFQASNRIEEWIDKNKIEFEFHFSEVSKHRLNFYKEFFLMFLKLNPTAGFKAIVINRAGVKNINEAITHLTFHLIHKGIIHENDTGRAPLPRLLQVFLDEEEKGSDQLKIENLKERLSGQKIKDLFLGDFLPLESKSSINIQAVDLFTASINRKIHNPDGNKNAKDELADYILGLLGFDINNIDLKNSDTDKSKVFNLTYEK